MSKTAKDKPESQLSNISSSFIQDTLNKADSRVFTQVGLFFVIAGLIAGALYLYLRIDQELTVRQNVSPPQQSTVQEKKEAETKDKSSEDQKRKNDVVTLNSTIKAYFLENKVAPDELKNLEEGFIKTLPKDPTSSEDYIYEPAKDKKTWKVWSLLSDGSKFEAKGP